MEHLEIWYSQRQVDTLPRLKGSEKHRIEYRHIIDWLLRKPGAFENYRYREDLFPTHRFRMAYDALKTNAKQYLYILDLAAKEGESRVDEALRALLDKGEAPSAENVRKVLSGGEKIPLPTEVEIDSVDLHDYDSLLSKEAACGGN